MSLGGLLGSDAGCALGVLLGSYGCALGALFSSVVGCAFVMLLCCVVILTAGIDGCSYVCVSFGC